ncbi:MAG: DMT family transporter [Chloroflexi bacterium]|nr:DMT family transporter [Chloroflexota bacterium]MDA1218335.1 DMT family transporter [Chloroflexota bacterium]
MIAIVLALLSALGFGSAAVFARVGMLGIRPLPSTLISAIASFIPSSILAVIFAFSDIRALPAIALLFFLGHGALTFLGGRAQNHLSINLIGASRSSPFIGSAALFAAILAIIFLGESLHPVVALGTVGVVGGLILSSGRDLFGQGWRLDRKSFFGYVTGLGAAASYGGSNLVAKSLSQEFGSPLVVAAFGMFFGILVLSPVAGRGAIAGLQTARKGIMYVALSGLSSAMGVITLYFALQRSDVVIVAPISSISPLVTLLLAYLFLDKLENVTRWLLVGTVLAVAGVGLVIFGSTL